MRLADGESTALILRAVVVCVGLEHIGTSFRMRCWWEATEPSRFHWVTFDGLSEDGLPMYQENVYDLATQTETRLGEAFGEAPIDVQEVRPNEHVGIPGQAVRVEQVWSRLSKPWPLPQGAVRCAVQGWSKDRQRALARIDIPEQSCSRWVFVNLEQCNVQIVPLESCIKAMDAIGEVVFATHA